MSVLIVKGNILSTGAKYIAHQCNCVSINSAGLAKTIFDLHPYANTYSLRDRTNITNPGTIDISGDGLRSRYIINIYAQYNPGPTNDIVAYDSHKDRRNWFHECLMEIAKIDYLDSIALPIKIGCGLAGGDWKWYFKQIVKFEKYVERKARVLIYDNQSE